MWIDKLLIIPDIQNIDESIELAAKYNCGFEYNDFFSPAVLEDDKCRESIIELYRCTAGMPAYCTSHGAFFDITVFSDDARIYEASDYRVEQSLQTAMTLGAAGVVFHTNYIPNFNLSSYRQGWVDKNAAYWGDKLLKYPKLNIYIENMFDTDWELMAELGRRMSDKENFGLCFDYAHAHVFGDETQIDRWVCELAPYVKHLHINDNDFCSDGHLALGEGRIDWTRFRKHYETYFAGASVLLEVNGADKIKRSMEYLKKL